MADSVYKQALDQVASQVKTLADAVDTDLTPNTTIPVRSLDWDDINHNLVEVCWLEDVREHGNRGNNERDEYSYPCVVLFVLSKKPHWDTNRNNIHKLKQSIRAYFHNRRRMGSVSETQVNELPCMVEDNSPQPRGKLAKHKDVHSLTIWCWFLQPRTS